MGLFDFKNPFDQNDSEDDELENEADNDNTSDESDYLYNPKKTLITKSEQRYYQVILSVLKDNYYVFPQINLATFISKADKKKYHNELFRNVDFLVTDKEYKPLFVIEINDKTHNEPARRERDEKVKKICAEAGIPLVTFWTSYGVKEDYIQKKITETLNSLPMIRFHHFDQDDKDEEPAKSGCYVATCVYGSYDCPEVWVLRRYRDKTLSSSWYGRLFIKAYYAVSPTLVKLFGKQQWFHKLFKPKLDKLVAKLSANGFENTPYYDR